MIYFFGKDQSVFAVQATKHLADNDIEKLNWLFDGAHLIPSETISEAFIGPRAAMVTPWSTNAVEITQNMGIDGIVRIEEFQKAASVDNKFDPMLSQRFSALDQDIFTIDIEPEPIREIDDIAAYNIEEGLSLSDEEVDYLHQLSQRLGRKLTDSEVFGFSQVNSEHCRHKIFNGTFIIDGTEKPESLFKLIKKTSIEHPNHIVSAYKDNVAFLEGPGLTQFAPKAAAAPRSEEHT